MEELNAKDKLWEHEVISRIQDKDFHIKQLTEERNTLIQSLVEFYCPFKVGGSYY